LSVVRHYFPGNNTPKGFFSYYQYILGQREANRIVCIKGGPGTGKSTFLRRIGHELEKQGEPIDYLHCSADADSLDGILLPDKKIAYIDGTSPHVIDPITPGAVDQIINFGEFWNDKDISRAKEDIIRNNEECSTWYQFAYNQLKSAKAILDNLTLIQEKGIDVSEVYKLAADIINQEYKRYPVSINAGTVKKFFATGITPTGCVSYLKSLLMPLKKIYLINVPEGYRNQSFMHVMLDGAIYRGFDVEAYYCPMDPEDKIEHLLIPELNLAFVTVNRWHDIEPWELVEEDQVMKEITLIDISDFQSLQYVEHNKEMVNLISSRYHTLILDAVSSLSKAKGYHDKVEKLYIESMDFEKVEKLIDSNLKILNKID